MTSNGPVVEIGKEHSRRDGGNQRCFLSNSPLVLVITTPAAHGKGSSQQERERGKESEGDGEIVKREGRKEQGERGRERQPMSR